MKYGKNNSRAKASLVWFDQRLSGTINALKRKPEGPRRALDNNVDEPDRTAVVTVFASLVSDGNLDFTNIPARPNPSLTITDDDAEPGGAISGYKIKSSSDRMNGVATVNTPATGAPMITGTSAPPPPCCERRPAPTTSRSSALAKAAGTLLAFAALLAPLPSAAQTSITLISNTGQSDDATGSLTTYDLVQAFTTGAHAGGYTLTGVDINFGGVVGAPAGSILAVSIWTDASGIPGTSVGALTSPSTLTANTLNSFTTSGINLAASTTYFVVVDSPGASAQSNLLYTDSDNEDSGGQSDWIIADRDRVLELHREGMGATEISKQLQIARSSVYKILQ